MKNVIEAELKNTKSVVESASAEKTVEFETDEGIVKEKITVNYKVNSGNRIDEAIDELKNSEYIKKTGKTIKTAISALTKILITFAIVGTVLFFIGVLSGIIH